LAANAIAMKYTTHIIIDLPLEETIAKLDNPENMKFWQKGLQSYEQLSGKAGEEGAQMNLHYKMGRREIDMVETIIKKQLPNEFHTTYDAKGVHNVQKNYFTTVEGNKTQWTSVSEFRFDKPGLRLMSWLVPGVFKKQSKKYLEDFKSFAENN
jgi:carbon monoxide dehydrogenase subunit G